jgi:hypothetical protein
MYVKNLRSSASIHASRQEVGQPRCSGIDTSGAKIGPVLRRTVYSGAMSLIPSESSTSSEHA